jgi:hypothetical protein
MKFKLFYSPFLILFVLVWMVSCNQNKSALSLKSEQLIDQIHQFLSNSQSEGISKAQKLDYLNQAQRLAQQSGVDSLVLKTFDEKVAFCNRLYPDSTLTVLKGFEKLAHSQKNSLRIAHSYLNLGEYYYNLQQKNTAFNYFNKSSVAFKESKDSSNVVYSLLMMSGIARVAGEYEKTQSM